MARTQTLLVASGCQEFSHPHHSVPRQRSDNAISIELFRWSRSRSEQGQYFQIITSRSADPD